MVKENKPTEQPIDAKPQESTTLKPEAETANPDKIPSANSSDTISLSIKELYEREKQKNKLLLMTVVTILLILFVGSLAFAFNSHHDYDGRFDQTMERRHFTR